jgi:DNA-binding GntR family transcriptional regulator
MPATLNSLYGDNLFDALVALRLPAVAPENVHLKVALAAQRLAQQVTIDIITHVYAQIVHKDYYVQEEEDRSLAFLDHRATLDGIVEKHVELAANAAAPHTSVGDPAH